jgi:hypothetical protein
MAAALLFSCAGEEGSREATESPLFSVATRAGAGTTYRVSAYSTAANSGHYGLVRSATYYLKASGDKLLTPCTLDDDGNWQDDTPAESATFNGYSDSYYFTCVSPGIAPVDGGFPCTPGTTPFPVATRGSTRLGGYGSLSLGDLVDYRSRVGFRFYKKNDAAVQPFTVSGVQLVGAGGPTDEVTLYPATRQVVVDPDAPRPVTLTAPVGVPPVDADGNPLCYFTGAGDLQYIASAIYAAKEAVRGILGNTPSVHLKESGYLYLACTLVQGGRNIDIRLPLTTTLPDLRPLSTYYFNITVKSNYITATVSVINGSTSSGWCNYGDEDDGNVIDGSPDVDLVSIGTWKVGDDGQWEEVDDLSQTIH